MGTVIAKKFSLKELEEIWMQFGLLWIFPVFINKCASVIMMLSCVRGPLLKRLASVKVKW